MAEKLYIEVEFDDHGAVKRLDQLDATVLQVGKTSQLASVGVLSLDTSMHRAESTTRAMDQAMRSQSQAAIILTDAWKSEAVAVTKSEQATEKFTATARQSKTSTTDLSGAMSMASLAASTLGISLSAAGMLQWARSTANAASELVDLSSQLDVSIDFAQRMKFAADQSRTAIDVFGHAMFTLSTNLAEGGNAVDQALAQIHLSAEQLQNKSREQQINLVLHGLANTTDANARLRSGNDLLGMSFRELSKGIKDIPGLMDGATTATEKAVRSVAESNQKVEGMISKLGTLSMGIIATAAEASKSPLMMAFTADIPGFHHKPEPMGPPITPSAPISIDYVARVSAADAEIKKLTASERANIDAALAINTSMADATKHYLHSADAVARYAAVTADLKKQQDEVAQATKKAGEEAAKLAAEQERIAHAAALQPILDDWASVAHFKALNYGADQAMAVETERLKIQLSETGLTAQLKIFDLERAAREQQYAAEHAGELGLQVRITQLHAVGALQRQKIEADYYADIDKQRQADADREAKEAERRRKQYEDWARGILSVDTALQKLESSLQQLSQQSSGTFGSMMGDLSRLTGSIAEARGGIHDIQEVMKARSVAGHHDAASFFGSLISGAETFLQFAGPVGSVINGIVSGVKSIAHLVNRDPGRDIVDKYAKSLGGYDTMHQQLLQLGADGERLWINLTQKVGKADTAAAAQAIDAIKNALDHAGDSATELAMKLADTRHTLQGIIDDNTFDAAQAGRTGIEAALADLEHRRQKEIDALSQYAATDAAMYQLAVEAVTNKYTALADRAIKDQADQMASQAQSQVDQLTKVSGLLDAIKKHTDTEIAGLGQFSTGRDYTEAVITAIRGRQMQAELSQLKRAGQLVVPGSSDTKGVVSLGGVTVGDIIVQAGQDDADLIQRLGQAIYDEARRKGLRL